MRKDRIVDPIKKLIIRKFINQIPSMFSTIENDKLIVLGDKICVCISIY